MQGTRVLHTLGLWRNRRRIREEAQQMIHIGSAIRSTGGTCSCDRARLCGLTPRIVHIYDAKSSGRGGFPGASEAARMRAQRLL